MKINQYFIIIISIIILLLVFVILKDNKSKSETIKDNYVGETIKNDIRIELNYSSEDGINLYTLYDSENNIIRENVEEYEIPLYEDNPNYNPELPEVELDSIN